jgi:hypothetical protein
VFSRQKFLHSLINKKLNSLIKHDVLVYEETISLDDFFIPNKNKLQVYRKRNENYFKLMSLLDDTEKQKLKINKNQSLIDLIGN